MVKQVRLYVEGGGDQSDVKRVFRQGFNQFLSPLREQARRRKIGWELIACGGRGATYGAFGHALTQYAEAFNVLLVDAEDPVTAVSPWQHLRERDGWDPLGAADQQCHLMIATMEAWLIADRPRLKEFYGKGFKESALPRNPNVEAVAKSVLVSALKKATGSTQKGEYHKTRHAPKLLERIDLAEVCGRAPSCRRLVEELTAVMAIDNPPPAR